MKKIKLNNSTRSFIIPSIIVIALIILAGISYAFLSTTKSGLFFDKYRVENLTLYIPKLGGFELYDDGQNDLSMVGDNMGVTVLVDEKSFFVDKNVDVPNLFNYTAVIVNNNDCDITSIIEKKGYYQFSTVIDNNDMEYYYSCASYEDEDNFYLVTYFCLNNDKNKLEEKINRYFEMIEVKNPE